MQKPLLLSVALLAISFAGCLEGAQKKDVGAGGAKLLSDLYAGPALWNDPQNAPHPAYNWPTLSSPPNATEVPEFWTPINATPLPPKITGLAHVAKSPADVKGGGGIAIFGSLAVVPAFSKKEPSYVLDISDPGAPAVLSSFHPQENLTANATHRGAAMIPFPDGRLFVVISTGYGLDVWNLTDPRHPTGASTILIPSHKVGVIPGTPIVYNAPSNGGGATDKDKGLGGRTPETARGLTGIYDLTDPYHPALVKNWTNGFGCHHVYFWNDLAAKKYRGLCAGIQYTQIWDTADPLDPKVIVNVPVHHGIANTPSGSSSGLIPAGTLPSLPLPVSLSSMAFSHYAGLSNDGKILVVGDENQGGAPPLGCVATYETPAGSISTPVGALWFYDVSNEKDPRLLGWYSAANDPRIKDAGTSCTAHHGRMLPVPGRNMVAMSFYGAGVILVDFTGIGTAGQPLPHMVAQYVDKSDTWETWYDQGYLFTGDLFRGMDVLRFK